MGYLVGLAIGVLVLAVAGAILLKLLGGLLNAAAGTGSNARMPFRKKDYLLTKAERSFYEVLRRSVDEQTTVFAKVRLLDLVWLPKGTQNAGSHRNRVQSKHVDFVLCNRAALMPMLVVELDDASHAREDRQARDLLVDRVLTGAGLPVLRVRTSRGYSPAELQRQIDAALAGAATP